jgi:MOSC domain-containing protein YiiM
MYDAGCKAGDIKSPHWGHGGFYARVAKPGTIQAGDEVILESDVA